MRIGLDCDGVISPYDETFLRYLVDHEGWDASHLGFVARKWEFYEDLGLTFEEYWRHHVNGINAGVIFACGDPYPRATRAISMMKMLGHEVHIITDRNAGRPGFAMQVTAQWLHKHSIPYDGIYFGALKDVCSGLDVFVDDRPKNVELMQSAGVDSWLLDRPYNQDAALPRVYDLMEFLSIIEERSAA